MKMSTKGRYAVMAMIDIGQHSHGEPVSLGEIALRQDISQEYLEQLFSKLRKAGLVESAMRLDAFRKPHPVYGREGAATFDQVASNKLSVRINLKNVPLEERPAAGPPDPDYDPRLEYAGSPSEP